MKKDKDYFRPIITLVLLIGFFIFAFTIIRGEAVALLKDATASLTIGTIFGYLANELKQALAFWFGTTQNAVNQTQEITSFAVAPGTVTTEKPANPGQ
ncbi:hypothetical protein JXVLWARM_CDS_0100 [Burkholderia phage Bm1]